MQNITRLTPAKLDELRQSLHKLEVEHCVTHDALREIGEEEAKRLVHSSIVPQVARQIAQRLVITRREQPSVFDAGEVRTPMFTPVERYHARGVFMDEDTAYQVIGALRALSLLLEKGCVPKTCVALHGDDVELYAQLPYAVNS